LSIFLYYRYILILLSVILYAPVVFAEALTISEIQFKGNKVTQESILRQELTIKEGDPLDQEKIKASRQTVMDLGLFKSVDVEVTESGVVIYTVSEKHFILFLPRISYDSDENELKPGARLTVNNIAGLNQRMKLTYIQSDAEDADNGNRNELGLEYEYPKILGGPYNLRTSFNIVHSPLQYFQGGISVAEYKKNDLDFSFLVTRWFNKTGPSSGWVLGGGMRYVDHNYKYVSGMPGVFADDHAVSLLVSLGYTDLHDHLYSRSGVEYGYSIEQSAEFLGSEYQFNRHQFYYRQFMPLDRIHHNLNVQARIGFSAGASSNLDNDAYTINGYGDLRAYSEEVEGDAFMIVNLEYLRPVLGRNHIRSLVFVDAGDTFDNNSDISLSDLKWAAGFGLRWKIKSFVSLDLSMEYGRNFDSGENKFYFKTKGAF
jgi:outer membrane protein assembly factor BamA